ncbi:aminopeptidase P family protein [Neisseria meningitidis]|uniref:aminopeptidase P family protein n=1 Tax=Neisseria meningitidis TaxID=487 RepID=UPI000F455C8B|nr:aminopeptidase P family protein [Neisseria meningitidis]RNJ96677.1 Xaa-Pro aminopeptidase [Neisseria meningitidis]RQJ63260.1 Xaa-Pro aminopeptidase [Neisseria meningitidis]RQK68803.1 Xaa-Pro aminopeptidase [Neisseria meningitidis]
MNTVSNYLSALREAMKAQGLDALVIPSADPHLSEYLPEHWQARRELSGFTGSVGTFVLTTDEAGVWVDSRYWEQAAKQLAGSGIVLQKSGQVPPYNEWLAASLPENAAVGIPSDMVSLTGKRTLAQSLAAKNIRIEHPNDLLDQVWTSRPAIPAETVFIHDPAYVSETAAEKLARVRAVMAEKGADYHLVSSLDDIAWLTNLRGSDVPFNPVFVSFLLIGKDNAVLFTEQCRLNAEAAAALQTAGITVEPYAQVADKLAQIGGALLIEPNKTAVSTLVRLPESVCLIEGINPSTLFKSCKSEADIARIREAMEHDGAALCGFFAEFEDIIGNGGSLTEIDVDTMLYRHRSVRPGFISLSFDTIAGFNANGALPHYSATPESHSTISGNGLLLIDSGAQYKGGTTDITRVVPVGTPTAEQKRDNTLVLKAHIALAEAVFPENIPSPLIDAICRKPLWQAQCDYGHGTGHGVGYFLNVHEGPQRIAFAAPTTPETAMKKGMVTSIEPGLYRPGKWGIRIENLAANQAVAAPQETEFGSFLCFETLTLCPIDTRLMDTALMTDGEIDWVNRYHAEVRRRLEPLTEGAAKAWLIKRTEPLAR